jgi:hypothetical protein
MFNANTKDAARTLDQMIAQAREECRFNTGAMAEKIGGWLSQDRRFDHIPDKVALAREAMDARSHGRTLNLTDPYRPSATGQFGVIHRRV